MVSATGGNHWIIEDCVLRQANAVALDIGYQDWDMEPPAIIGHSIVRRNHIIDAGVCGLAGMGGHGTPVETNPSEHVGWQDGELTPGTGGIKMPTNKKSVLRN